MKAGNYTIEQQGGRTRVHYTRSLKDWLDILFYLVVGSALAAVVVFLVLHFRYEELVYWLLTAVFSFVAFIQLAQGFTRLTQATRSVIVLDHGAKKLTAKYPYLRRTVIPFGDISHILLKGQKERFKVSGGRSVERTYCAIEVLDIYGESRPILFINPTQVFNFSERKIETGVYATGQKVAKLLAAATGTKYHWKGYTTVKD